MKKDSTRRTLVLGAAALVVALATNAAQAAPEGLFVALRDQGFAPVVVAQGETARFANLDGGAHAIASEETDAEGEPLFWSEVMGIGEIGAVHGVEYLSARDSTYDFYCPLHTWMKGKLVVGTAVARN